MANQIRVPGYQHCCGQNSAIRFLIDLPTTIAHTAFCLLCTSRAEDSFFQAHAEYREVVLQCGVGNLARRLNAILVEHIRVLLPGLRRRISEAVERRMEQLRALGDPQPLQTKSAR